MGNKTRRERRRRKRKWRREIEMKDERGRETKNKTR